MTQFSTLTSETQEIVINFFNAQMMKGIFNEPAKQLMVSLYSLMPNHDYKVIEILNHYQISIRRLLPVASIEKLKAEYPAVVRFCYDHQNYGGIVHARQGELITPQSLIDLCMGIAEPKAGSSVFVPFAGNGSFAYHVPDCTIEGFESNEIAWAFSQVLLHSQNKKANIKLGDSGISEGKCYDYIFSFPPLLAGRDGRKIADIVYELITNHLSDDGELYCVLPMAFCFQDFGWFELRKRILWESHEKCSTLVISLPNVLFLPYSQVSLCLLHIKKNHKDIVALMDASSDAFYSRYDVAGAKEYVLKTQSIIETLRSQDEKCVWVGKSNQLTGAVNLQPSRYLLSQVIPQPKEGEVSIRLSDVVQVIKPSRRDDKTMQLIAKRNQLAHQSDTSALDPKEVEDVFNEYRKLEKQGCTIIGMKQLFSSYLNCDIDITSCEKSYQGVQSSFITSDCLLVGFIGGKFKVGRLHGVSDKHPVSLKPEVIAVKVAKDKITEDFFLRCIMSHMVELQAKSLATGTTISRLTKNDLLSIVINIPATKLQQDALCREDTRIYLTEADKRLIKNYEEFRRDMHMKKHAIGQTLFNLNNWWDALQQARMEGNGIVADDATTGKIRKVSVSKIYDSLQNAIDQLQQQINKFDRGNGLLVKKFALAEFVEYYISHKQSPLFDFLYISPFHQVKDLERDDSEFKESNDVSPEYVEFAPDALEIIFDNIVSNACSHGFKGREDKRNYIKFELKSDGDNYVIVVSNNGEAIHNQIKPEEVFVYGKTSKMGKVTDNIDGTDKSEKHFGIGGYEVQKLMQEFGGTAEFISEPESDFPVSYKLTFFNSNF